MAARFSVSLTFSKSRESGKFGKFYTIILLTHQLFGWKFCLCKHKKTNIWNSQTSKVKHNNFLSLLLTLNRYWLPWNSFIINSFHASDLSVNPRKIMKKMKYWPEMKPRYPAGNYMFKVNNRNGGNKVWNMFKANGVVLVSLLLTLNIFYTLF